MWGILKCISITRNVSYVTMKWCFQHYQCEINQENVETHIGHIPFDGATLCRSVMISHEESKTIAIRMKGQCHAHEG